MLKVVPEAGIGDGSAVSVALAGPVSSGHRQVVCLGVVLPGLVVVAIATRYKGCYRYPIEVIGHVVWLYHRFALSLRDVEELMLARGVAVSYETIRSWCARFGPDYAVRLRRRRPRPGDKAPGRGVREDQRHHSLARSCGGFWRGLCS